MSESTSSIVFPATSLYNAIAEENAALARLTDECPAVAQAIYDAALSIVRYCQANHIPLKEIETADSSWRTTADGGTVILSFRRNFDAT